MLRRVKVLDRVVVCMLCALLVMSQTACSSAKDPSMTLTAATLGETAETASTVNLALRLHNPNNDPLELLEFDYRVDVDGKHVYSGKRAAQMTLARLSTRDITLPAVVPFEVVGGAGWPAGTPAPQSMVRVHGTLRYISPGAIQQTLFDTGVRRPSASFKGEMPLQGTAPISPSSPAEDVSPAN